MEARAHAARTAYYDAAALMLAGKPFKKQAAIAKLIASEAAMDNARDATQIHGGYGFMLEYDIQLYFRRAKAWAAQFAEPAVLYARAEAHRLAAAPGGA